MIKAIAIDDEPLALKVISNFCTNHSDIQLLQIFTRTDKALVYLQQHTIDLLFLDIQMPKITGIQLYRKIESDPLVIFTTAYSEYAVEGFDLNAVDYLLKPFTKERFNQAIQKVKSHIKAQQVNKEQITHLILRVDYSLVKVRFSDIEYIAGLDDYVKIHLFNQRPLVVRMTMKAILEKLPQEKFIRVHRSYIVSFVKIEQVKNKEIKIGNVWLAIGNSYEEQFFNKFKIQ